MERTMSSIPYATPEVNFTEDTVEDNGVVWFIVAVALIGVIGLSAYCINKGMNLEAAFKLNPLTWKIGCTN
ncbi:hypothetical protein J416_14066 [Gracilibacillus halophilus YIM-C55.5]|uniref:Uncharacterized protein n=1 Tax=Gracilibacillus halophilus YIM-C55.5 TaxID=1308866 RepID=N4W9B9_9BACI|nr:hypothetical protein [Gracilibacillus halophilus]ENH95844.1 hypothetical protein J416_14066 [Gracilibacillus halophilus YIM-C55.5]